jgi:hypothetical protein
MADKPKDSPASLMGVGIFLIALGIGIYAWLAYAEAHGGGVRLPIYMVFLYEKLGKWGAAGLCFLFGLIYVIWGAIRAVKDKPE